MREAICSIPRNAGDACIILPRATESNGLVIVELKRKLQHRSQVYFESIRPTFIFRLLQFLKTSNILYFDNEINLSNTTDCLISCNEGGSSSGDDITSGFVKLGESIPVFLEKLSSVRKKYCSGDHESGD